MEDHTDRFPSMTGANGYLNGWGSVMVTCFAVQNRDNW